MSTSDRVLLSALVDHSVAPRILDIHLDDCDDNACTGCEPEHLTEQGAAKPTARDRLIAKVAFGSDRYEADFLAELDAYRAEVRTATLEEADEDLVRLEQTLRRLIEDQKAAKARWRARAEKAEELVKNQRAEVLAEAAVVALELRQFEKAYGARAGAQVSENVGIIRVADELTRLAEAGESRG